ncbi:MAG: lipoyl synthase [Chloroflexi bacterium]|nr:lipoyl synthase [Chloroflexota bacterium]
MKTRLPPWLKVPFPGGQNFLQVSRLLREKELHTVCQEARCPNIGECFEAKTATFLILGDVCTRSCRFCAVAPGHPSPPDLGEAQRVAQAAAALGLRYVVVTSVTRDDLPDGGAGLFATTIAAIRESSPGTQVEVLIPDFGGSTEPLETVMAAHPTVLSHNVETVPRLYPRVRPRASYHRSLELLGRAAGGGMTAKSGLMLGLGEEKEEVFQTMADLREQGCHILTLGQYLRPSPSHLPVERFYTPEEFQGLGHLAQGMGFIHVESGPLVRSSYHAHLQAICLP